MALFGAPLAHEDHAVRACYAALAMQTAVKQYAAEVQRLHGVPVQIRVGLNAGKVVVRTIGSDLHMDYTAVGQTTHLAARMEQMAMPGSILLTQAVLSLAEGYVQVTPLGPMPVKGVAAPVDVFELVGARGAYRLAQALATLQVPATVQAVLTARIDRLPPEEKRLLQTAAVIGTEVPLALLQAMAEVPDEALRVALTHLQAAEFLYETRLFPDLAYTFKHALTHEVAYGSILQERRRTLHAGIVETLERLTPERVAEGASGAKGLPAGRQGPDQVDFLAHHALRGEVWDKAVAYGRQAGTRAMGRSAYHEAMTAFEQALMALEHLPESRARHEQAIDLRLALRSALFPSGDFRRVLAYLREAESLAAALDDRHRLGQVSNFLSVHFYRIGTYDQAIIAAQRVLALAMTGREIVLHALANLRLGLAYHAQGEYRQAIDAFKETVASLDRGQHRERFGHIIMPAVHSCAVLAWCHAELGMFTEGRAPGDEGLQIAEAVAHPASLMIALWGNGLLALRQGDLPSALPLLERAMGICHEADLTLFFPWIAGALGGRVADAVPLLTQAMQQTIATAMSGDQTLCSLPLGEAHMVAGRLEEAQALAEDTLALARAHQQRDIQAYTLHLLGDLAMHRDPPERELAAAHYQQALTLAEEIGMRPLQAHCHRGLGLLYAATDQRELARTTLATAIDLYRAMKMTFWLPETEAALAQVEAH